jgi:serine/threonine protein kinase/Tol biopolymer transport system component
VTDNVARLTVALADRYRLVRELGEGGMATVYLAEDLKNHRQVALKVLRPELSALLGAERFLREIEVTANLQHPHLLPLFDSGQADGLLYYVMPYVAGESLREKLNRETQLGIADAVRIATQVASALDYAHRRNVIHRDIKPENILLNEGQPLIADFGIALALRQAGGDRLTGTGLSVGTPSYMSPEQATGGRALDARSDIYSLACVLYEMLSGEPPHTGPSVQAVIAKVVTDRPRPVTELRDTVPAHVAAALEVALTSSRLAALVAAGPRRGAWRRRLPLLGWAVAAVAVVAAVAIALLAWRYSRTAAVPLALPGRFNILLPDSAPLAFVGRSPARIGHTALALSPDGSVLVYVGLSGATTKLFVRPIDSEAVRALPGTDGAYAPFFSPDGRWVGFFVGQTIRKIALAGGEPQTLADANVAHGATWAPGGRLLVSDDDGLAMRWVPEGGGAATLAFPAGTWAMGNPVLLPDSTWVLGGQDAPLLLNLRSGEQLLLTRDGFLPLTDVRTRGFEDGGTVRYLPNGHVVWAAGGRLFAIPFDLATRRVSGQRVALDDSVRQEVMFNHAQFAVAGNGTAVFVPGAHVRRTYLMRADLNGNMDTLPFPAEAYQNFTFSPDGTRIAAIVYAPAGMELWVLDLRSRQRQRVLATATWLQDPLWRPDGTSLLLAEYGEMGERTLEVSLRDGTFTTLRSDTGHVVGLARNGAATAFRLGDRSWVRTRGGARQDLTPAGYLADFSPDGGYVAWSSLKTGHYEVFVAPLGRQGSGFRVTSGGCLDPRWTPDSRGLLCQGTDAYIYSVRLQFTGGEIRGDAPRRVLPVHILDTVMRSWDLSPDGRSLLFLAEPASDTTRLLTVVMGFPEVVRLKIASATGAARR